MNRRVILAVVTFAAAFGLVEAAVVAYLRQILGIGPGASLTTDFEPWLSLPGVVFLKAEAALVIFPYPYLLEVEKLREAATIVMLICLAALAGRKLLPALAYFLLTFGVWDIFYYIFLNLLVGWPQRLTDTDVLFFLPVPWIAPVWLPVTISLLMIASAFYLLTKEK